MAPATRRSVLTPKTRRIVWLVGSVLVVAIAIAVASAFSLAGRTTGPGPGSQNVADAGGARAYDAALSALASGETTKALELLRTAIAAGNPDAQAKLDELAKRTEAPTPATPAPLTGDSYVTGVADLATLLPTEVSGYTVSGVEKSKAGAIVSLQPTYQGPYGKVTLVVMSVLDQGTEAAARAYVEGLPRAYSANGEAVSVGAFAGRFGTDGSRLAAVAFSRGRYAFEVVATASRPDPKQVRDITLGAAAAFPAAR